MGLESTVPMHPQPSSWRLEQSWSDTWSFRNTAEYIWFDFLRDVSRKFCQQCQHTFGPGLLVRERSTFRPSFVHEPCQLSRHTTLFRVIPMEMLPHGSARCEIQLFCESSRTSTPPQREEASSPSRLEDCQISQKPNSCPPATTDSCQQNAKQQRWTPLLSIRPHTHRRRFL